MNKTEKFIRPIKDILNAQDKVRVVANILPSDVFEIYWEVNDDIWTSFRFWEADSSDPGALYSTNGPVFSGYEDCVLREFITKYCSYKTIHPKVYQFESLEQLQKMIKSFTEWMVENYS